MIGGDDLILEGVPDLAEYSLIMLSFYQRWPDGVWHDVEEENITTPLSDFEVGTRSKQTFVYENQAAFESWKKDGATPKNDGLMAHVIMGASDITVVVDDRESKLGQHVVELLQSLKAGRKT